MGWYWHLAFSPSPLEVPSPSHVASHPRRLHLAPSGTDALRSSSSSSTGGAGGGVEVLIGAVAVLALAFALEDDDEAAAFVGLVE